MADDLTPPADPPGFAAWFRENLGHHSNPRYREFTRAAWAAGVAAERARIAAALQAVADEYDRQAVRVTLDDELVRRAYVARDMIGGIAVGVPPMPEPTWTTERPTAAGWWWLQEIRTEKRTEAVHLRPVVVRLADTGPPAFRTDLMRVYWTSGAHEPLWEVEDGSLWAGPLVPPGEG